MNDAMWIYPYVVGGTFIVLLMALFLVVYMWGKEIMSRKGKERRRLVSITLLIIPASLLIAFPMWYYGWEVIKDFWTAIAWRF